ncbi:hypothetical protein [Hymenobacter latericus]|uniref:hypothetical protein n=1 Tax=Hymenobacter sp. YIM 151858-1 TaxID=2987688 RepID=UPI0022276ADC|nr:hypothetical protein [Hymenobacter sp. YIM 151858-1]UYZ61316.1 hypothetical protein OIS50_20295 [Hymenobacter sp. YIM 151858-1]
MQDITFAQLAEKKAFLDVLRTHLAGDVTPAWEQGLLSLMDNVFSTFFALERPEVITEIQRVTVNRRVIGSNSRLQNIGLIKYPPADKVAKYGRCNIQRSSVLYAGFNYLTILSELKPEEGDLITVSHWENTESTPMRCFSIIGHQPPDSINIGTWEIREAFEQQVRQFPPHLRELFTLQVEFLADAFSRLVRPGSHLNYLFSAFFAGKIMGSEIGGEAIIYPSVQQRLSFDNIAIKANVFDRVFRLKEAKEMVVLASPFGEKGYSTGTFSHSTGRAKEVQEGGQLNWINSYDERTMTGFEREYKISFS